MIRPKVIAIVISVTAVMCMSARSETRRQVAISIDDLPYTTGPTCDLRDALSFTATLLKPLREGRVPVLGLVIGVRCSNLNREQRARLLQMWLDVGAQLGNHTWSHPDLNKVSLHEYEQQILAADKELHRTIPSVKLKYFRAPYLHDGATAETKKDLQTFLQQHGYTEAPVTLDNNDWVFAAVYDQALQEKNSLLADKIEKAYILYMTSIVAFFEKRSREVLGRECPEVLLIHASELNARMLPQILQIFKSRAYEFVSLDDVMRDECYRIPDGYVGPKGLSWIHRWGLSKGKEIELEPAEPEWIDRLRR